MSNEKEDFIKNYNGIYPAESFWNYLEEVEENKKRYRNATYSAAENRSLLKEANEKSFNKHLRR